MDFTSGGEAAHSEIASLKIGSEQRKLAELRKLPCRSDWTIMTVLGT